MKTLLRDILNRPARQFDGPGSSHGNVGSVSESISDAFVYRAGDSYRTRFDLINIASVIQPSADVADQVRMEVRDSHGKLQGEFDFELGPLETRELDISDYVEPGSTDLGTFYVFHQVEDTAWKFGTCLSDRSYVGYRSNASHPWSFVHGCCNSYVLARDPVSSSRRHPCRRAVWSQTYRPQIPFSDAQAFELVLTNPLAIATPVKVKGFDKQGNLVRTVEDRLGSLVCRLFRFDNPQGAIESVAIESHVFGWRPLVFKFYAEGWDVLHS